MHVRIPVQERILCMHRVLVLAWCWHGTTTCGVIAQTSKRFIRTGVWVFGCVLNYQNADPKKMFTIPYCYRPIVCCFYVSRVEKQRLIPCIKINTE